MANSGGVTPQFWRQIQIKSWRVPYVFYASDNVVILYVFHCYVSGLVPFCFYYWINKINKYSYRRIDHLPSWSHWSRVGGYTIESVKHGQCDPIPTDGYLSPCSQRAPPLPLGGFTFSIPLRTGSWVGLSDCLRADTLYATNGYPSQNLTSLDVQQLLTPLRLPNRHSEIQMV